MSKIPFRNINIGVNVAEHTRRDSDDDNGNSENYSTNSSKYRNSEKDSYGEKKGNSISIIKVIVFIVLLYALSRIFQ